MLAKAATLSADEIVIDLEDAVAADAKDEARAALVDVLAGRALAGRAIAVRVNGLDTPWCERDVSAIAACPEAAASLVIPKVESPRDVERAEGLIQEAGGARLGLQVLLETAAGLQRAGEIAAASPLVEAVIIGYADLRASLGRPPAPGEAPAAWVWAQETVLVAARAAGVQAIDGPYLEIRDEAGLRAWAAHVRALGYDGKWAIHPAQLDVLNDIFAPTPEELSRANAIVEALDEAERAGRAGAAEVDGEMVDAAHLKLARQILARGGAAEAGAR
jgi:citrate lyase subunit beta / citryl-CoA lyase